MFFDEKILFWRQGLTSYLLDNIEFGLFSSCHSIRTVVHRMHKYMETRVRMGPRKMCDEYYGGRMSNNIPNAGKPQCSCSK